MKKIREIIKIALAILVLSVLIIYEIGSGMLKSCAYVKYIFGEENSTASIATSQENEETEETKTLEIASIDSRPTGKVALQSTGMAEAVDKLNENIVVRCTWSDIELTQSELELLYTTVYCESGGEELEAQIMVAQTILNRMLSDKYPDTLRGIVYQRNAEGKPQFAVINWPDFESRGWSEDAMAAVHYALAHRGYPANMLYFRDSYYHDFGQPYKQVGNMFFSLSE